MVTIPVSEIKAKLPPALHVLVDRPELRKYLLPDVAVRIDPERTDCMHVTFSLTWLPAIVDAIDPFEHRVEVLVWDEHGTLPVLKVYRLAGGGETITDAVELPLPPDARFEPDYKRRFFVAADPFRKIGEVREKNNFATVVGTCVG